MSRASIFVLLAFLPFAACSPTNGEEAAGDPALFETFRSELRSHVSAAEAAGTQVVTGEEGWLFFAPELRGLTADPFWGSGQPPGDPLPAIVDFHRQLREAGIELLLVPVPAKAAVYPEKITSLAPPGAAPPRLDGAHGAFLEVLRQRGVPVVDLLPLFLEHRETGDGRLYCRQDTHWSGRGIELAARALREKIGEPEWLAATPKRELATESREVEITGDLWRMLPEPRPPKETLPLTFVGEPTSGGGLAPVEPWRESPVLLLGDSHGLVFHAGGDLHARSAGLADHLARELGFAVDLVAVRGSGATPARVNLLRRRDNLAGKRLVLWCLSAREFTAGQGWKLVPVIATGR